MDFYGFYMGNEFQAYEYLGAHPDGDGTVFRTFAPNARAVSVIGEFNGWTDTAMGKVYDGNFWECRIPDAKPGMMYKFRIYGRDGSCRDHCDPYGRLMELRPHNASIICENTPYDFQDDKWMRQRTDCRQSPLNIYEIHAGSWRCKPLQEPKTAKKTPKKAGNRSAVKEASDGSDAPLQARDHAEQWYTYRELADLLIPYLLENHFNYVELLPLSEHPSDESWGYQITGFFSPTSRYGKPEDLKYFVSQCHRHGIGVLMDFVPVHFAPDDYGLWQYDGTALYEYPHSDVGASEWGSCNFMHSRGEVRSFLQSAAEYWLREFHFDGLRMDAISNLIYWQGNPGRGENRNAVHFLQNMNRELKRRHPSAILAAEDSTARPDITKSVEEGGLGFDYKWDMGWMNDTLSYFQSMPEQRTDRYHNLTFSMQYYYQERYLLPLSHDENVHGKATILQKMNGEYEMKFPQARALYLYMYTHPGKKLQFMGGEFGQLREWDEKRQQDWDMLKYPAHDSFGRFIRELSQIYLESPALWEKDFDREGFTWLDCHQEPRCLYAFERRGGGKRMAAVFNFSGQRQAEFRLNIPGAKALTPVIFSDRDIYGGDTIDWEKKVLVKDEQAVLELPAFCGRLYWVE